MTREITELEEEIPELTETSRGRLISTNTRISIFSVVCDECLRKANRSGAEGFKYFCEHITHHIPSWVKSTEAG
jgi:hypothetical protein